ncbi:hypothetical protein AtubIFM54640_006969 [Aspergillus tubingensis]|nr:hypothetical protein AtubIFM54640_006969 [Aspergillus tubingensis]
MTPPASVSITQPAQTSQAQQPPSQYMSKVPAATAQRFSAAEPMLRIERTIAPPSSFARPSFSKVRTFVSQLAPVLSEPHSIPTSEFSRPFNGPISSPFKGSLVVRFKIEDDTYNGYTANSESKRNTGAGKSMHKIDRTIDRINYKRGCIG